MEWTRGPTIGRGATAAVSLATTAAGDILAVKSTDISNSATLQREQSFISQLNSNHIIKCLGSDTTREKNNNRHLYNLFLEYFPRGTLADHAPLDEAAIRSHAHQLLLGLSYLHGQGIAHCDIKGSNLLIGDDRSIKIADFGCARVVVGGGECRVEYPFSGTPAYMAPEVARGEDQGFAADVWAVGCTVIEMATGSNPWTDMKDPASALYRIGFSNDVPETPPWLSCNAKDFLSRCLVRDPEERWIVGELLQHPFLKNCGAGEENEVIGARKSPTSVMDRGFWDAFDRVSGCEPDPVESVDGYLDRLGALVWDARSGFPDWEAEVEGWLTVRGVEVQEREYFVGVRVVDFSSPVEEDVQRQESIANDDCLLLDCLSDEIVRDVDGDASSSFSVDLVDESVVKDDNSVVRICNFEENNVEWNYMLALLSWCCTFFVLCSQLSWHGFELPRSALGTSNFKSFYKNVEVRRHPINDRASEIILTIRKLDDFRHLIFCPDITEFIIA